MSNPDNENVLDITAYKNHFALDGKGKGCSKILRGKVCIVAFMIQEAKSAWREKDVINSIEVLKKSCSILMTQSGLSPNRFSMSYAFDVVPVQLKFDRDFHTNLEKNVLKQYGPFSSAGEYQDHYEKKFSKDEAPVVFILNRDFRSFAIISESAPSYSDESSFVSYYGDINRCARTLVHELLHQFGAIDLYLPEKVTEAAEKYLPDSIMNRGNTIDPLTRYLIGWDEEPSEEVLQFLEETKDITRKDVADAREKDSDNDW